MTEPGHQQPLVYPVGVACEILGIGRSKAYDLMGREILDARKLDGKTVITAASIEAFVASLPKAEIRPAHRKQIVQ